jgi:RNA polymerase sigma-70 factor (ECF subfamily)
MAASAFHTTQLHAWIERIRAGDAAARDELVRTVLRRLEGLARKMLRRFPAVARWNETADVLQNALLRLLRSLEVVTPDSTRAFFCLAAEQVRRELLDLTRRYARRPRGTPGNPDTLPPPGDTGLQAPAEPAAPDDASELDRWTAFHEAVERLPTEEREVVGLIFYHGWTQAQVAELFGVHERTVRRRWHAACVRLNEFLGGTFPQW